MCLIWMCIYRYYIYYAVNTYVIALAFVKALRVETYLTPGRRFYFPFSRAPTHYIYKYITYLDTYIYTYIYIHIKRDVYEKTKRLPGPLRIFFSHARWEKKKGEKKKDFFFPFFFFFFRIAFLTFHLWKRS